MVTIVQYTISKTSYNDDDDDDDDDDGGGGGGGDDHDESSRKAHNINSRIGTAL